MKIQKAGNALILTSEITMEELRLLKKYSPNDLKLKTEDGEDMFAFAEGENAGVSPYGICFTNADEDGKATVTLLMHNNCEDKNELIADILVPIKKMYETLEKQIVEKAEQVIKARNELIGEIN